MITTEVFMEIISLHRKGLSMRAIAKKLGIHRSTVKRHIEGNTFPQYQKIKRQESIIDPYRQTIDDYLATDDYQATWLLDRLKKMGYPGSYETLRDYVALQDFPWVNIHVKLASIFQGGELCAIPNCTIICWG